MNTKLVYNVVYERNGKIEEHNIFNHAGFYEDLVEIRNEYKKDYSLFLQSGNITGPEFVDNAAIATFKDNYKKNTFKVKLLHVLRYYFWARAEYEIILTDWPTAVTREVVERAMEEFEERDIYRVCIDLPVSLKVDVYDQVILNYDLFVDYVWNNLDQL